MQPEDEVRRRFFPYFDHALSRSTAVTITEADPSSAACRREETGDEALGDTEAHRVVESCLQTLRAAVAEYEGRVVKAIGDELLCVFNDAQAAIGVASEMHSRLDAGTFVRFDAQPELHLRREETVLVGHGLIGFGESTSADGAEPVAFAVQ